MHSHTIAILFSSVTLFAAPTWQAEREAAIRQQNAGNYGEAERLFRSALATLQQVAPSEPHIPEILNNLGADCHLLGRFDDAEHFYREALSLWRSQPSTPP